MTSPLIRAQQAAEADAALAAIFQAQYAGMVRLAVLLGADDAEDIVAEAFYQLYRRWRKLRDGDAAVPYLRSVVCNLTRMRLRHLQVVRKHATPRRPSRPAVRPRRRRCFTTTSGRWWPR
ncbi:hypothetical protein Phou_034630 [Phytohabitans houttuyneae]|uniref:RNA polymerase sigma-70 region 2 domain-containing protein n=1 Tax=Phytohabitans houttuyneae TaxID=1076126 RepID=A0A6V8K2D3_9ACTN|nr:hypothetical protein Phou_034630 [Phytohabitans houttuyneae]